MTCRSTGADAADAQLLAKTGRFLFYRDSGPTLALTRRQQVEHEAYLTLMAARAGVRVPAVLAAGPAGPAHDALLVTRPPDGTRLSEFARYVPPVEPGSEDAGSDGGDDRPPPAAPPEEPAGDPPPGPMVTDDTLDDVFAQLITLRTARIAHGALSTRTIVVDDQGSTGFVDFRAASTVATDDQLNRDLAAAMAATAEVAGPERVIASASRSVPNDALVAALPFLQRAALGGDASRALKGQEGIPHRPA